MRFQFSLIRLGAVGALLLAGFTAMVVPAQAALLTIDVRVAPQGSQVAGVTVVNPHSATVNAPGLQVAMEVYAVIANGDNTQTNDGFQKVEGSFVSGPNGGPLLLGGLRGGASATVLNTANNVAPFNSAGATSGFMADLDADTDLDVGNLVNHSTGNANDWFLATSGAAASFGIADVNNALEQLIGKSVFTVGASLPDGSGTLVDFAPRVRTVGNAGAQATDHFVLDGVTHDIRGDSAELGHAGSVISSAVIPEPATFVLFGLGGLGMFFLRRRSAS